MHTQKTPFTEKENTEESLTAHRFFFLTTKKKNIKNETRRFLVNSALKI